MANVMIVDDVQNIRIVVEKHLKLVLGDSVNVIHAPSAEVAIKQFGKQPVDGLFVDFQLPSMTGADFLMLLPYKPATVMMSAEMRLYQAQFPVVPPYVIGTLQKPIQRVDIRPIIEELRNRFLA